MKPIKINSLENFIDVFGNPMDGVKSQDPWRDGNTGAPSYAGYAAQAYLASGVGPVKFIRLAGLEEAGATGVKKAGWNVEQGSFPMTGAADVETAVMFYLLSTPLQYKFAAHTKVHRVFVQYLGDSNGQAAVLQPRDRYVLLSAQ